MIKSLTEHRMPSWRKETGTHNRRKMPQSDVEDRSVEIDRGSTEEP